MERMQKKNNPEDDPIRGCCNLMAAFLCGGMWDFIRVCTEKGMGREEVLQEAAKMMTAILHSRAFPLNL